MAEPAAPPGPGAAPPAAPRTSLLLVLSVLLSAVSAALPAGFGPLGPFAAGVLALLGWREVRRSGGAVRGPGLARFAMTLALVVLAVMAWAMIRYASSAEAIRRINAEAARVEQSLRRGTPEGAWDLLSGEARRAGDRERFVADLRAALARLGPLESLGGSRPNGGDWDRRAGFDDGDASDLRLGLAFDARFQRGPGRVEIAVRIRRRGREVASGIEELRVVPGGK